MFDVNERALDWLPTGHSRNGFVDMLSDVIVPGLWKHWAMSLGADGHYNADSNPYTSK